MITIYFSEQPCESVPSYILDSCKEIAAITFALDSRQAAAGISRCHSGAASFSAAVSEAIHALNLNFYSESNIALFSDFSNCEKCDLTAENSLDLFRFESSLNNWLFDDASCVLSHMIAKFKSNFINSQDAKNICAQIYYICCRVLIKKDGSSGSRLFRPYPPLFGYFYAGTGDQSADGVYKRAFYPHDRGPEPADRKYHQIYP